MSNVPNEPNTGATSNLDMLKQDLKRAAYEESQLHDFNFDEGNMELTEEEKARLEKMKTDTALVVEDTGVNGMTTQLPLNEYAKSLDERVANLSADTSAQADFVKMINQGDIIKTAEQMKKDAREQAVKAFRELAITSDENVDEEDLIQINNSAIAALAAHFGMERLDADVLLNKLKRLSLSEICRILPDEFVRTYVLDTEIKFNNLKAKERLLSSIAYLTVTGPEMDYLNEYIEDENKMIVVSQRLMQCQIDFTEALKSEQVMSEIVAQTVNMVPIDESFWAKYIKMPNRVHNEFAQRAVIYGHYKEAYQKILEDYPESDPSNARARQKIQEEIDECDTKIEIYSSICDMTLLKELWSILTVRLQTNKKTTMKSLLREGEEATDRIRRSKLSVPFPAYKPGLKKAEQIFKAYMQGYPEMVLNYNKSLQEAMDLGETKNDETTKNGVTKIELEGYNETHVALTFSLMLLLLFGRVMKKLSKNDMDKFDAITLDAYFQLYCRSGMDVYIMTDLWNLTKDFVKYVLDHYWDDGSDGGKKK